MSPITTHVLDTSSGRPAEGVAVTLELKAGPSWNMLGQGSTDADGRLASLLPDSHALAPGVYRIAFDTEAYFAGLGTKSFYPEAAVVFRVDGTGGHYHVPLLLSPFGYSTYRGS